VSTSGHLPAVRSVASETEPAMCFDRATLAYGDRVVWSELSMTVPQGEFLAVLGPNGSGKTSLLRALLGLAPLAGGSLDVLGKPPQRGNPAIGYVPQHAGFDRDVPLRGRDLVGLGIDGNRWGFGRLSRADRARVTAALEAVAATAYADAPVGRLSGEDSDRGCAAPLPASFRAHVAAPEAVTCWGLPSRVMSGELAPGT
jgi:zinc/manganese transport system ATP-binding protein